MMPADPFRFAAKIGTILDEVGIPYVVGGSVAAMLFGEPRFTQDLDIMIDADEAHVRALAARLADEFYIDADAAADAVRHCSTFNAIHIDSFLRVDFFIAEDRPEVREQLARGRVMELGEGPARVYAPEDIVVRKLRWFRVGGETSDQQWRDVVGVLRVSRDVDSDYLHRAAAAFGVADLLEAALQDAS